jgi:hypothetical protein
MDRWIGAMALSVLLAACQRPLPAVPVSPPHGRWIDGDLHVHSTGASNDTDKESFSKDIAEVARARGLDFVILTDHSNSTGGMSFGDDVELHPNLGPEFPTREVAASLSVPGVFLMVVGNEISPVASLTTIGSPRGHIGCLPREGDPFAKVPASFAFVDRPPGAVTGGAGVAACHGIGGIAVVNHPYAIMPWVAYDWTAQDYDAIEVFNGGLAQDTWDLKGVRAWWCDRSLGRNVAPVGASDCHRAHLNPPGTLTDPYLGVTRTLVFVRDFTADGLGAGLSAGHAVAHDDAARLDVWASAEGLDDVLLPGDRAKLARGKRVTFHASGRTDRGTHLQIVSVGPGECVDHRGEGDQGEAVISPRRDASVAIGAGEFARELTIDAEPGRDYAVQLYHPLASDTFGKGLALTNAFRLER